MIKLGTDAERRRRKAVVLVFPLAFAAHDLEEVLAAPGWSERAAERMGARHPGVARALGNAFPMSQREMTIAVAVVAAGAAGVTAASLRDLDGELQPLRAALGAFSAHSLTHLAASVVFRGYTPGLATVPLVIVPYSLWAWARLGRAGVVGSRADAIRAARTGLAVALPLAVFGHLIAREITGGVLARGRC